jgi:hemolysin III
VGIYLAMGWAFLLALPSLSAALSPSAFAFLILGGAIYSVGAVIFALDWPSLFRTRVSAHDFWHVLVLLGSASHYALVLQLMS